MPIFGGVAALFSQKAAAKNELAKLSTEIARDTRREIANGVRLELVKRGYDAARVTRLTWGWLAPSTSANAEVYYALLTLRNRTREMVRNNPHVSKILRTIVDNSVGTGIICTARTPDKKLNAKIDDLWERFVEECDFGGQLDYYGLQRIAIRLMIEGGEMVVRKRTAPGKKVPLELQFLEGDYIDHRKNIETIEQGFVHQGIEFSSDGKRIAYWLFRNHPGEFPFVIPLSYVADRIPAADVLHLYEIQRIGQIRGLPWFAPVLMTARELDSYQEAELVRKRIEACVAAIVMGADDETQEGIVTQVNDANGEKVEQFEPGMVAIARGAKDIKFTQPAATGGFPETIRVYLQKICAGSGVTYEVGTGDLSRTNYSSIKAGMNEFRRSVEVLQWLTVIPMMLKPIWKWFINYSIAAGELPSRTPYDVEFTTPKFEAVDPVKEADGDISLVRALGMAPQEFIRRRGFDPDVVLEDHKVWHDQLVSLGLVSDADASQVGKAGANTVAPAAGTGKDV